MISKKWLAILLSPIFLCMATCFFTFAYGLFGRVTDFRAVSDNFRIPNTDYTVRVSRIKFSENSSEFDDVFELALENTATQNRFEIGRWSVCGHACLPYFTFLNQPTKSYFLIKYRGYKATHFQVYDISLDTPRELTTNHPERNEPFRNIYTSCEYPRLENNKLIFEYVDDCELYPFSIVFDQPVFYDLELD